MFCVFCKKKIEHPTIKAEDKEGKFMHYVKICSACFLEEVNKKR